jgi:hypothetical protein
VSLRTHKEPISPLDTSTTKQFLIITCGATRLAVPAEIIRGIVRPDDVGVAETLAALGVTSRVTDLAERFGVPGLSSSTEARIVACETRGINRAFHVTGIIGLHDLDARHIAPLLPHFTGPERRWFAGMFLFHETVALVVDAGWLLSLDHGARPAPVYHSTIEHERNRPSAGPPVPQKAARDALNHSDGKLDVMELEEVSDAEDIPWAEL